MRKKLFFGACAALFLGTGIVTAVKVSQAAERASAMVLDNVEALAESEIDRCPYSSWTRNCPGSSMQLTCSSSGGVSCDPSYLRKCPC